MDSYENCRVLIKANIYFEGRVQSRTIFLPHAERKTLGVILPGEYEFATGDKEIMDIVSGKAFVLMPGKEDWESFEPGVSFSVPARSSFKIKCIEVTEYICSYVST